MQYTFPLTVNADWSHCHCYRLSWFPLTMNTDWSHCHCYSHDSHWQWTQTDHIVTVTVMIPIDNEHRLITLSLLQAVMIPFDSEHTLSLLQAVRITVDSEHTDHIVTVTGCHDSYWQWTQTDHIVTVTGCWDSCWQWTQADHIVTVTGCLASHWQWTHTDHIVTVTGCHIPVDSEHRLVRLSLLQAVIIPIDGEHRLITLSLLQAVMIPIDSEHWSHCHCYSHDSHWQWTQTDHIVTVTGCHIPIDCEHRLITLSWLQAVIFPLTVNTDWSRCRCYRLSWFSFSSLFQSVMPFIVCMYDPSSRIIKLATLSLLQDHCWSQN